MKKTWLKAAGLCLAVSLIFGGYASSGNTAENAAKAEARVITDEGGNQVELPEKITKVAITPIPWASAVWTIDGGSGRIVSINPSAMAQYKKSFMTKLAPEFADISTGEISQDFSINIEELMKLSPEVAFIWNDQEAEAEKLKAVGITPVMLNYAENLENLKKDLALVGKVLDKEDFTQELIDYHNDTETYFTNKKDMTAAADQKSVLYLQNNKLSVAGSKNINNYLLELTGGRNVAAGLEKKWAEVNMEQIMEWNPEIIYLSNFDDTVKNHRVYKTPVGTLRWDAPCVETPLMLKWMGSIQQPEIFSDYDIRSDIKDFYKKFFNHDLTDEEIDTIYNVKANQ